VIESSRRATDLDPTYWVGYAVQALAYEKGYQDHADCMPWIATDAKFDTFRDNAQFRDLVSRVGLKPR